MHEYDTVLKSLLADSENRFLELITGARRGHWLNVELPKVAQPRVDLLFRTTGSREALRRLISLELQSFNDLLLPVRMAEYSLAVYRVYKIFPEQFVLYVGGQKMSMPSALIGPNLVCRYTIVNMADLDAETLLKSPFPADNILAILGRYSNKMETIGRILARIAKLETAAARVAFSKLIIVAGLRKLEDTVKTEAKHMPILNDIMDHKVIGPAIRQGLEQGLEQGERKGKLDMLRRMIKERFGKPSAKIDGQLAKMSVAELNAIGIRLMSANRIADLFGE